MNVGASSSSPSKTLAFARPLCAQAPTGKTDGCRSRVQPLARILRAADRLFVSRNTVKAQSIAIYRKLGTSSRAGAVEIAADAGLID